MAAPPRFEAEPENGNHALDLNLIAFNTRVRMHRDRIFGLAFHMLGNEAEAADVTQDVFIRLWKHHERLEEDLILGWLLRVARNACIDAMRRRKTRRTLFGADPELMERVEGTDQSPEQSASAALFRERLDEALECLGEPHRSIVVLREIHECKYEEISETLDLPLNTVKVYLHRARKALRKELGEVMRHDYV